MAHQIAEVVAVENLSADIRLITLSAATLSGAYSLGAHIDVDVQIAGASVTRSYSLIGSLWPDGHLRIAVKLSPQSRGGSRFMWSLTRGDQIRISPPKSCFPLVRGASEYLLIAGGIGITPLIDMAATLKAEGKKFRLVYAAKGPGPIAFTDTLAEILGNSFELYVASQERHIDLEMEIGNLAPNASLYVCGPSGLMQAAQAAWRRAGRAASDFHMETFGTDAQTEDRAFEVELADLGSLITIAPNQTVLDAILSAGYDVGYQCRRGECGLCAVKVLSHDHALTHRDVFLSPEQKAVEQDMCICVSRAVGGRLVIDTGYRADVHLSTSR